MLKKKPLSTNHIGSGLVLYWSDDSKSSDQYYKKALHANEEPCWSMNRINQSGLFYPLMQTPVPVPVPFGVLPPRLLFPFPEFPFLFPLLFLFPLPVSIGLLIIAL